MSGLGLPEAVVIALVVAMLFGPTLVAFWVGFVLGKRRANEPPREQDTPTTPVLEPPTEKSASDE